MGVTFSLFVPPPPTLTEKNLPNQQGKVFLITGGTSGIGFHLARMLYQAGGKVYITARSETKAQQAIEEIKASAHSTSIAGQIEFILLKLEDLSSIRSSVASFTAKESKLDILFNNAGVSFAPIGTISKHYHEPHLATNCLGPYLFTQLLIPSLKAAAQNSESNGVRVIWTTSIAVDLAAPKGGINLLDLTTPPKDQVSNYINSKAGNWFLASELSRQLGPHGILSVAQNPGNLKTNLLRHKSWLYQMFVSPLLYDPVFGAYTELWAGTSPDLTIENVKETYVTAWGRTHPSPRKDLVAALKGTDEGGTGQAGEFRDWCEKMTEPFR